MRMMSRGVTVRPADSRRSSEAARSFSSAPVSVSLSTAATLWLGACRAVCKVWRTNCAAAGSTSTLRNATS